MSNLYFAIDVNDEGKKWGFSVCRYGVLEIIFESGYIYESMLEADMAAEEYISKLA